MNGKCISASKVTYMAPSSIHYIHPDNWFGVTGSASPDAGFPRGGSGCLELDRTVNELTAIGLNEARHLKVQIVEKEGHWFALNSSQLELCRRLEKDGLCSKVKVDIVPSQEVPLNVRNLMTLPVYEAATKSEEDTLANERTTSQANRACGKAIGGRKGYRQLDQEEREQEDFEKDERRLSPASNSESNNDDDADDTEEFSSDVFSDSDIDWSEEDDDDDEEEGDPGSSEGEWSNNEVGDASNDCDAEEIGPDDDEDDDDDDNGESNCLL